MRNNAIPWLDVVKATHSLESLRRVHGRDGVLSSPERPNRREDAGKLIGLRLGLSADLVEALLEDILGCGQPASLKPVGGIAIEDLLVVVGGG
jgi:hypothetical protein